MPEKIKCKYPIMPQITISSKGILKLLPNLKKDKAAVLDDKKPLVLKELKNEIIPVVKAIFERSLETDQLPKDWTQAWVTPLFKKGYKCDPEKYRPLSSTCILCKVMAHIVASNVAQHLNENDILYGLHNNFREKRSCETQLLELDEELCRKESNCHQVYLILTFTMVILFNLLCKVAEFQHHHVYFIFTLFSSSI